HPAGGLHQPTAAAGDGAAGGDREGGDDPVRADRTHLGDGDRGADAVGGAGEFAVLAAGGGDHRGADPFDAVEPAGDAGVVLVVGAGAVGPVDHDGVAKRESTESGV